MFKKIIDTYSNPEAARKREPVIVDYIRTPLGAKRQALKFLRGDEMCAHVWKTLKDREAGKSLDWEDLSSKNLIYLPAERRRILS